MFDELHSLLLALDGVRQDPRYHPEGDALYHSLQVFDLARRETDDRQLWAAALLHDVGKAVCSQDHDEIGADLLEGLVSPRIVFLVRHHLDLLNRKSATRARMRHDPRLDDLVRLRRWDARGRSPRAEVLAADEAVCVLLACGEELLVAPQGAYEHEQEVAS